MSLSRSIRYFTFLSRSKKFHVRNANERCISKFFTSDTSDEKCLVVNLSKSLAQKSSDGEAQVKVININELFRKQLKGEREELALDVHGRKYTSAPLGAKKILSKEEVKGNVKDTVKYSTLNRSLINIRSSDGNGFFHTLSEHLSKAKDDCEVKLSKNPGRVRYSAEIEDAINKQIMSELNAAFGYLAIAAFFGRNDVGKLGTHEFFMDMFKEEIGHALVFLNYQLSRGGHVKLTNICVAESVEWCSIAKAIEISLEMEKMIADEIFNIIAIAKKNNDVHTENMLISEFITEQFEAISKLSHLLAQAVRIGKCGISDHLFDQELARRRGAHGKSKHNK